MRTNFDSKGKRIFIYFLLILWALISIFPVYWMLTFSLKSTFCTRLASAESLSVRRRT